MDVLGSRILLRPANLDRSRRFYRDSLGLAVHREFGDPRNPALVFFLGGGLLEVSGQNDADSQRDTDGQDETNHHADADDHPIAIWLQVRELNAEHVRLKAAGVAIVRAPRREPWGLLEMWITDPDGVRIVLVEVPADHPLRRDQR
jgi:catechol 2,3-dioxygenase-like lactoylglutathione lyase family enzyme